MKSRLTWPQQDCSGHLLQCQRHRWGTAYQLPLLGGQGGWGSQLLRGVAAAEGVAEAVDLHEHLVLLLVDVLALRCLVEHGGLWL